MTSRCSLLVGFDLAIALSVECSLLSCVSAAHLEVFAGDLAGLEQLEDGEHFCGRQLHLVSRVYPLRQPVVVLMVVFEREHHRLALSFH